MHKGTEEKGERDEKSGQKKEPMTTEPPRSSGGENALSLHLIFRRNEMNLLAHNITWLPSDTDTPQWTYHPGFRFYVCTYV